MNREIKFRAWHAGHKYAEPQMLFDEKPGDCLVWLAQGQNIAQVMQYSGFKDRKGNDIYEGDFFTDTDDNYLWQIFFSDGCYYAASGSDTLMLQEFMDKSGSCDIEVIGNIYENPELLEDKSDVR
ncbi:hypothetical protein BCV73_08795 [Paenibacillus sp. SSG-1]|uniref:YopX family protein n=1 Tax=Paenibacillus sp. SSG-1 TaxID=1443669 RepID=UPI000B7D517D|nr:YopX family protein [Paenibacillus sp. SSG-1]OXL83165.1 hypothetical protein BCV73_08795 [Paenibacillus sp. SSG-1]